MPGSPNKVLACIELANTVARKCQLGLSVKYFYQLTKSDIYTKFYESICKNPVPDVFPSPMSWQDEVHNCQCVINSLSFDILNIPMQHITGEDIISGESSSIYYLLEIIKGLYEILYYQDKPEDCQNYKNKDIAQSDLSPLSDTLSSGVVVETLIQVKKGSPKKHSGPVATKASLKETVLHIPFNSVLQTASKTVADPKKHTELYNAPLVDKSSKNVNIENRVFKRDKVNSHLKHHEVVSDDIVSSHPDIQSYVSTEYQMPVASHKRPEPASYNISELLNDLGTLNDPSASIGGVVQSSHLPPQSSSKDRPSITRSLTQQLQSGAVSSEQTKHKPRIVFTLSHDESHDLPISFKPHSKVPEEVTASKKIAGETQTQATEAKDIAGKHPDYITKSFIPRDLFPPPVKFVEPLSRSSIRNYYEQRKEAFPKSDLGKQRLKKKLKLDSKQTQIKTKLPPEHPEADQCRDSKTTDHTKRKSTSAPVSSHSQFESKLAALRKNLELLYQKYILEYLTDVEASKETCNADHKKQDLKSSIQGFDNKENGLWLQDEFAQLELTKESKQFLRNRHLKQLVNTYQRKRQLTGHKKTKSQAILEEAILKQTYRLKILRQDQIDRQRIKKLKEAQQLINKAKNHLRDVRLSSACLKQLHEKQVKQSAARVSSQHLQDEMVFKELFQKALAFKRQELVDLEKEDREHEQQEVKKLQTDIEEMEKFYKDQFSILVESVNQEREDHYIRRKAQQEILRKLKEDFHQTMKNEIKKLQNNLKDTSTYKHFRQLDSDTIWNHLLKKK